MLLDFEGFKEKVYRRTQSQSSVDAYMKGEYGDSWMEKAHGAVDLLQRASEP
jgi:hypothetical protein